MALALTTIKSSGPRGSYLNKDYSRTNSHGFLNVYLTKPSFIRKLIHGSEEGISDPAKQLDRTLFPETPITATANIAAGLNGDPTDVRPIIPNGDDDDGADGEWESNPLEDLENL